MAKVTSKLQLTLPKALAERFNVKPGDEVEWVAAGDAIRLVLANQRTAAGLNIAQRLRLFDQATHRQQQRQGDQAATGELVERGWTREDLYLRGRSD